MEPLFLSLAEVLEIHQDQITRYGGEPGLRDLELLKSALGAPMATFGRELLHAGLHEIAAAYLFHITRNHPFVDGNKRTDAAAALVFLLLNGLEVRAGTNALAEMVLSVACGRLNKPEIALFFRNHTRPV